MADEKSIVSATSSTKIAPSDRIRRITILDKYTQASIPAKIFLFLATAHTISLIILSIASFAWRSISNVYGILAIFVSVCLFWFMKEGILKENTLQLIFSIISAGLITLFLLWLWSEESVSEQKHAIVILLAFGSSVCVILYVILAPCVINKFGWYRYNRAQTTNTDIMDTFYVYQQWQAFVLMDAEVCIMFCILVTDQLLHAIFGYVFNFVILAYEIIWVAVSIRAVRTENITCVKICSCSMVLLYGYIGLNLYWITDDDYYSEDTSKPQFFVLGAFCVIVRAIELVLTYKVSQNFGKGLREFFNAGDHYNDFWGGTNQHLLDDQRSIVYPDKTAQTQETNSASLGGMSSRSRLNSKDFD
eukprot:469302_1